MKILIVLSQDEYIRNYCQTGAFESLQRDHECYILVADRCTQAETLRNLPGYLGKLKTDASLDNAHYDLFNVLTWQHRKTSRTFYFRFSRLYKTFPNNRWTNIIHNLRGLKKAARYVLLGNRAVGKFAIPRLIARCPVNPDLDRVEQTLQPDLVLLPCSAYDPIGNDLARLGSSRGFRTLFLVDNWDNLSSKSIFWATPDFLGVWGEQSREHATSIHGIAAERLFLLGTPRFENYYTANKKQMPSPYPFPYVLFCGVALAFNEVEALRLLDEEIYRHPELYGDLRIVYRPHPQRQQRHCPDVVREEDFHRVVLDQQVKDA